MIRFGARLEALLCRFVFCCWSPAHGKGMLSHAISGSTSEPRVEMVPGEAHRVRRATVLLFSWRFWGKPSTFDGWASNQKATSRATVGKKKTGRASTSHTVDHLPLRSDAQYARDKKSSEMA